MYPKSKVENTKDSQSVCTKNNLCVYDTYKKKKILKASQINSSNSPKHNFSDSVPFSIWFLPTEMF